MNRKTATTITAGVAGLGVLFGATAAIGASASDDNEQPIVGDDLVRASAVALEHTGEGRVTETEVGDEDSYYEVEVTLNNGSEIDVQLDEAFNVVSAEVDQPGDD